MYANHMYHKSSSERVNAIRRAARETARIEAENRVRLCLGCVFVFAVILMGIVLVG
jgi:hypothetical protein